MTAQEKLTARVVAQNTATLKEMAVKLMADTRSGSEIVLSTVLDVLMTRLPEAEFVAFCDGMEA